MPKTRDGVEIDRWDGFVWVIRGGQYPSAIVQYRTSCLPEEEIRWYFSTKAAAVAEAQARIDRLAADYEREYAAALAYIAGRREWLDAMRADLTKPAALASQE